MNGAQIVGLSMLAAVSFSAMFAWLASVDGWVEVALGFAFAIGATVFITVGILLLTGDIR